MFLSVIPTYRYFECSIRTRVFAVRRKMWIRVFLQLELIYFSSTNKIDPVLPCAKILNFSKIRKISFFEYFCTLKNAVNVLSRILYSKKQPFSHIWNRFWVFISVWRASRSEYHGLLGHRLSRRFVWGMDKR